MLLLKRTALVALLWRFLMTWTRFVLMLYFFAWRWISCSQEHREHCHGMSPSLQQFHHHPPEGSPFQHRNSTSIRPNIRLRWERNRRILWPATECHWSDTEEGHSCCTTRLECNSGQGCLWKLTRHLWTHLKWWHNWERTQTSGVCHL